MTIHDRTKSYLRDLQRTTPTADKSVNVDQAYDAELKRLSAACRAELDAEDALYATTRGPDCETVEVPLINFRVKQAG